MKPLANTLDRFLFGSLLLLLLWLPLPLGSNRDWALALFVLVTATMTATWLIRTRMSGLPMDRSVRQALLPFAMLIAVQCWVFVQWLSGISQDSGSTFQYLLLGTGYSLLYLLTVGLVKTRRRLTWLLGTLVVGGSLQAFYGAAMTLSGLEWSVLAPKNYHIGNATGTFVNRNHLAGYLELTLACGIGLLLAMREPGRFRWAQLLEAIIGPKGRLRLALVLMVAALVMSHSRMGNTAFFASLILVGAVFVFIDREHRKRNSLILVSVILIDVLVVSQFFGLDRLRERIAETRLHDIVVEGQVVERANELRGDVFSQALVLAQERPLLGQGAGSFEAVFPRFAGDLPLHFDHAHNDFLQFWIEYGAIGCLPLAAFVLLSLRAAFKAMRRRESAYRSGAGFGAALGIVALLIHSFTDFNLQIPCNAATFIVVCAVAVLASSHRVPHRRKKRSAAETEEEESMMPAGNPRVAHGIGA